MVAWWQVSEVVLLGGLYAPGFVNVVIECDRRDTAMMWRKGAALRRML